MNNLYTFLRSLAITLIFVAAPVFAIDASNVDLLNPSLYAPDKAQLNANVNIGIDSTVEVWFEYGLSLGDLGERTDVQEFDRGYHFMMDRIIDLNPGTHYYYRAVIRHDGSINRTDIETLKTLPGNNFDYPESDTEVTDTSILGTFKGLKNPLDFFKRNKGEAEPAEDELAEAEPVEYSDDPVGGVVNEDSVYFTDEDGEVIEYSDEYRNKFKKKTGQGRGLVIFIIIILIGVIIWLIMKTRRRTYGKKPNTRRARIQRLNQYRHPQQYRAANDVHAPVPPVPAPSTIPTTQPRVTEQATHSAPVAAPNIPTISTKQPVGYQGKPVIQRQETQGTIFKTPPKSEL